MKNVMKRKTIFTLWIAFANVDILNTIIFMMLKTISCAYNRTIFNRKYLYKQSTIKMQGFQVN
jgi:hypothetical protein